MGIGILPNLTLRYRRVYIEVLGMRRTLTLGPRAKRIGRRG